MEYVAREVHNFYKWKICDLRVYAQRVPLGVVGSVSHDLSRVEVMLSPRLALSDREWEKEGT